MADIKPNFFIIGAPKCGTTSMAAYLSEHPNVCMSRPKEPTYFSADVWQNTASLKGYNACFAHAEKQHKLIGDATPIYLYSKVAVQNILIYQPDAKFIVMIRNPVDAAYALFNEFLNRGAIATNDFETAWRDGLAGKDKAINFHEWTCFGQQIQRLLNTVDQAQVHVIVFDDLASEPKAVYESVLTFLDLPFDDRANFPVLNQSQIARFLWLSRMMHTIYSIRRRLEIPVLRLGIFRKLESFNSVISKRPPLNLNLRKEMAGTFQSDIELLSDILKRDLTHWLQ